MTRNKVLVLLFRALLLFNNHGLIDADHFTLNYWPLLDKALSLDLAELSRRQTSGLGQV